MHEIKRVLDHEVEKGDDFQYLAEKESPGKRPFAPMEFAKVDRCFYLAEIGKKEGDYLYHFFPKSQEDGYPPDFKEKVGDAFLAVFKQIDRLCWDEVTEPFKSIVVRAIGYAQNPLADDLAVRIFDVLDRYLSPPAPPA